MTQRKPLLHLMSTSGILVISSSMEHLCLWKDGLPMCHWPCSLLIAGLRVVMGREHLAMHTAVLATPPLYSHLLCTHIAKVQLLLSPL